MCKGRTDFDVSQYGPVAKSTLFPGSLLQHSRRSFLHTSITPQHHRPYFCDTICGDAIHTVNSLDPGMTSKSVQAVYIVG